MRNRKAAFALAATLVAASNAVFSQQARTPNIRTLTEQEMVDMMVGSSIQATRSSDSASMIKRVRAAVADGRTFTMVSLDDVPDDWTIAVPGAVGGGGAWEYVLEDVKRDNLPTIPDVAERAMEELRRVSGKKIDAIMRVEAAGATLNAFMVASKLGIPVVDTCLSARARPDRQSMTNVHGVRSSGPSVAMSRWGDVVILSNLAAPYRSSHILRALAVGSGGVVTTAGTLLSGSDVKRATIKGSVSQAILWGRTVREAVERKVDPIDALTATSNGYKLFQGIVVKDDGKGDRGYTYHDVELKGIDEFAGHTYKIWVKNENIVTWLDGKPDAMSPDFISNLDPKTGDAITGGEGLGGYPVGKEVVIVGIPASPMWRVPKGLELFGPRAFGFDFDYVPVEQQMKLRPSFTRR
jgi:uncharacterized protein